MTDVKENKMGTWPVGKLLVSMSLPAMFSMLIQALYNIVDSIFVSRVSEKALTALSLAFPMQNLMIAFSTGVSVGITSLISRRLGQKREEDARNSAQTGYSLVVIVAVVASIIGFTCSRAFFSLYTDDAELLEFSTQYLTIVMGLGYCQFFQVFCEKAIQSTGDTIHPMIIQISGAVFNVVFDPIFIFGYFGLPAMGVKGAAIATVAGQFLSMILGFIYLKKNSIVSVKLLHFRFNKQEIKDILTVGIPTVILTGIGTIMTSLMNAVLISYDVLATTVFGVYFKVQSFVYMPIFGMNQGLLPILGYNYGAKNKQRMMKALKLALVIGLCIMITGFIIFQLFPDMLLGLFNASDAMLKIGIVAFRTVSFAFPIAAINIICGTLFQSMGDGFYSMMVSVIRQLVFLVPLSWLMGKLFGLDAIWLAFIIADIFALMVTFFYLGKEKKKLNF